MKPYAKLSEREKKVWDEVLEHALVFSWVLDRLANEPGTPVEKTETMYRLRDAGEVEFVDLVDEDGNRVGFDILAPEDVERRLELP